MGRLWVAALFWLASLLVAAGLAPSLPAQPVATPLTSVEQVRKLSPERARAALPVRLHGFVLVKPAWYNSFFFSDGKYGISVDLDHKTSNAGIHPGDTVDVVGTTNPGQFAPSIDASSFRITGHRSVPPAPVVTPDSMRNGQLDSQWITVRGTVRSAQVQFHTGRNQLELSIDMGAGRLITARVTDFPPDAVETLDGAIIRITGICGSSYNMHRQFIAPRLYVTSVANIHVERAGVTRPYAIPVTPLATLMRFNGATSPLERVHVRGVVTFVQSDHDFYVQQGPDGVFIDTDQDTPVKVGMSIEAVGFPKPGTYSPSLVNASMRPASPQPAPPVPAISAHALLAPMDAYVYAPYDSLLVRLQGKLIDTVPGPEDDLLLVDSDGVLITAKLHVNHGTHLTFLRKGSILALTGVSSTITSDSHEAHASTLLLRSAADIQILHAAPWWTGAHAWWAIVALVLLLLVLLGWIAFMRRQARLRDLVARDPLTGLYNRRGFLLMAERQWNQAVRHNRQILLFYIDLDRFKQINDSLGHKTGDLALQHTATLLRDCFRKSDIIGRLGGDEFAITSLESAGLPEEDIRTRLQQALTTANATHGQAFKLRLSMGVLFCDETLAHLPIEDLLSRADSLMYQQKRHNRLASAEVPSRISGHHRRVATHGG